MKLSRILPALLFSLVTLRAEPPAQDVSKTKSLFDGKSLAGWEGNAKLWQVQDGVIAGGSLTETVTRNEFLATEKSYADFDLRAKIRITGKEGFINSGIQIRSQRVPNDSEMSGYQCDAGDGWWGKIYDESRRNKVIASPADEKALTAAIKKDDWNDYVIRAEGARIRIWINGVAGSDYIEADPKIPLEGKIGLQVHGGGKALIQFKDVTIEELPQKPRPVCAPEPKKAEKPSPVSPEEQRASFTLPPGFEMELVVSEDEAKGFGKFIAAYFDQKGRLWTMTALEYPVDANENPAAADALYASKAKDKILVYDIVDRGTNGGAPKFAKEPTVFADGLAIPLGILPYKDGCYVQHGHDIALLRDTDGDGKSDKRETILTGFGVQDSHLFPHQFTRAPGGWIWMAQGAFNYGKVRGTDGKEVQFDQTRMARFRPDGSEFEITSNGPCNIWGLVMNGEGETFIQEANDFGYPVMPFHEYANYPGCSNGQWKSYAPEFPPAAEFRMGGTGLSGLALTDASGAYPPEWSDVMLVANPIIRKIQAIKMHRSKDTGTGWKLELLPDFVQTSDEWFRPIAMTLGPDGCVYIVDWYNKIISHNEVPRNHPERDKKRGRIWRVKHRDQKCFPVPDFTKLPEGDIVGKLGSASLAQSHLAWQTLSDKEKLNDATVEALRNVVLAAGQHASKDAAGPAAPRSASPYPDAARIQAMWAMQKWNGLTPSLLAQLLKSRSRNVRREAIRMLPLIGDTDRKTSVTDVLAAAAGDSDFEVRCEAIRSGVRMMTDTVELKCLLELIHLAKPAIPEPMTLSGQNNKPIKAGRAYEREFERYLIRLLMERVAVGVARLLDVADGLAIPSEGLMLAALSLPPKDSAPRVAKLIAKLERAPSDEELLRLAEAPDAPEVKAALAALIAKPESLQSLLKQRARFDARVLAPLVEGKAKEMLTTDAAMALEVIRAFKLTALEREVALRLDRLSTDEAQLRAPLLRTLRELGSKEATVFLPLVKSTDAATREEALACLAAVPDKLIPLWGDLSPAQRSRSLDALSSTKHGAAAVVTAVNGSSIPKDELDGPVLEKLAAVLGENDAALTALMEKMGSAFRPVLTLDGKNDSWVKDEISLTGPFTVECWVKLAPGIGNDDSILGWANEADFNFYGSLFRVWIAGPNDVIIAKKPVVPDMWTHVAVTRDAAGHFRIYLNGELDQSEGKPEPKPLKKLRIGHSNVPQGTGASLSEYRVWNVCRTPEEIRANFDRTFPGEKPADLVIQRSGADWGPLNGSARVVKTTDFPAVMTGEQAKAMDAKYAKFHALATKPGNAEQGKLLSAVCIGCHTINGAGGQIGPNLSGAGAMGVDGVLRNLLNPNAAMEPGYRVYRVEMRDGSLKEGFLVSEDDKAIVFRAVGLPDERIPRDQIRGGKYLKRSLMPEGLLEAFNEQQISDLFSYLMTLK
jgi:putative membrane-bound dehydrogenase-like protein